MLSPSPPPVSTRSVAIWTGLIASSPTCRSRELDPQMGTSTANFTCQATRGARTEPGVCRVVALGCQDGVMALDVELSEIRDFLAQHPPFDALPAPVLGALPARLTAVSYTHLTLPTIYYV